MGDFERSVEPWASGSGPGDRDAVFHALAHPYRRFLLEYLGRPGEEATVTELAATIASSHGGVGGAGGSTSGIDTIESSLYHMHLPKLTETGLVEFDPAQCTVTATPRILAVRPILEAAKDL